MKKEKNVKDVIIKNSEEAIDLINKIYHDFDVLNGHLHELSEVLDSDKRSFFFSIWNTFPTYSTFDDLTIELNEIKEEAEAEKEK
jgi:hypothetical protein